MKRRDIEEGGGGIRARARVEEQRSPRGRRGLTRAATGLVIAGAAGALGLAVGCSGAPDSEPFEQTDEPAATGEARDALSTAITCLKLGSADTHLSAEKPFDNYGNSSFVFSGASATGVPTQFRALFRFDIKSIPVAATLTSAKITLNTVATSTAKPGVHLVTGYWVETGLTWDAFGAAYNPVPFTTLKLTSTAVTFDVLPQAQAWVNDPTSNRGILIEQDGSTLQTKYKSGEYSVSSQRPVFNVCYKVNCAAGFADCDGKAADGCEADLSSPASCGACGHVCAAAHATPSCTAGACGIAVCDPGWGDCDGDPANGCEASLAIAPNSTTCGACGVTCGECGGFIGLTCPAGQDCIDRPNDGCDPYNGGNDCQGICVPPAAYGPGCPMSCDGLGGVACPDGLSCSSAPWEGAGTCSAPTVCSGVGYFNCPNPNDICWDDPTDNCDSGLNIGCPGRCVSWFDVFPQFCGGPSHQACSGDSYCQDVPCDGCDPAHGGVNCIGTCVPTPPASDCPYGCGGLGGFTCPAGLSCGFNPACGPDVSDCGGLCMPPASCSGIGSFSCPSWDQVCSDDPTDNCNGAVNPNCPGRCTSLFDPAPTLCGGAAGATCPQGSVCSDLPCDGCDPAQGGIDCVGVCSAPPPSCTGPNNPSCPISQVCHDDAADACAPSAGTSCPGTCVNPTYWCGGPSYDICPDGLFCVDHPNNDCIGPDCWGVCVPPCATFPYCY
ncbi:MAG: DNRLRE domain-containing protein [Byssovorax sp.]